MEQKGTQIFMEIHQLRYFCAAADTGSFTRGAHRERVTQPTLSQQLLKLEKELGTKLFDRGHHRIRLTASGQIFLRSAKLILSQVNDAKQEMHESSKGRIGSIAVGSAPTLTQYLLSPIVQKFSRSHPSIKVRVVEDFQARLLPALRSGLLDLALVHLPIAGDFRTETVLQQSFYVAVPKNHVLAGRKQVRLAQLGHETFLLLRESLRFGAIVRDALRKAQIEPDVAFEGASIDNILAMVDAGAGISLIPEMAIEKRGGCRFIPVESSPPTGIGWAILKNHSLTTEQRLFMQTVAGGRSLHRNGAPV